MDKALGDEMRYKLLTTSPAAGEPKGRSWEAPKLHEVATRAESSHLLPDCRCSWLAAFAYCCSALSRLIVDCFGINF